MQTTVRIVDEFLGQQRGPSLELQLAAERVTARDLIRRRVTEEVALLLSHDKGYDETRPFLIRVGREASGIALKSGKSLKELAMDEAEEVAAAIAAFEARQFILLFDERQIERLDEEITLTQDSEIVFLRLTPLVGG